MQAASRELRVVVCARCPVEGPGGVERVVREVTAGLVGQHPTWKLRVVSGFRRPSRASRIPLVGDLVAASRMGLLAAWSHWDVFLVNGAEYAWAPLLIGKLRRRPVVVAWHGVRWREAVGYLPKGEVLALLYRIFFRLEKGIQHFALGAAATVAVGPNVADEIRKVYGFAGRVRVICNGAPPSLRTRLITAGPSIGGSTSGKGSLRVLWVGAQRQPYGKGLDIALTACALARRGGANLALDVVGLREPPRELGAFARAPWITWHGPLLPTQMAERYTQADVLLSPTRYEGCSMVVLESLASSVPVVGSSAIAWQVADAGVVVEGWEASSYATALGELWRSPLMRKALAQKASARASRFTWEDASASYAEVLEAVVHQTPSRFRWPWSMSNEESADAYDPE